VSETTESLSESLKRLSAQGFTHGLRASRGILRDLVTGDTFAPDVLEIEEVVRFEGESDPDEQAALFALRSPAGSPLGTYVVVFGAGMPQEDAEVVHRLAQKG
jgi:hypothetical protein